MSGGAKRVGPRESLLGCYLVVCDKGDFMHDYVGVYATLDAARAVGGMSRGVG
jgi:hypothetical protein